MADNILDQLRAFQQSQEAARRTVEQIVQERNLLREVANLAKSIKLEFNETTKNIGKSAGQLKIGEELERRLQNSIRDRNSFESELLTQLQSRVNHEKQINELQRIQSLSTKDRRTEYLSKLNALRTELSLGTLTNAQFNEQRNILLDIYGRTGTQLTIQNQLLGRVNAQIMSSRNLLNEENKTLDALNRKNELMGIGKKILGDMGPLGDKIINFRSVTGWNLVLDLLSKGYENFKLFDKTAVDVRMHLGLLPGEAKRLETLIEQVGIETMHLGASFEDVGKSIKAIADEFTFLVATDKSLLITTTALSKQFDIAESSSLKFLKTLGGISGKTVSSQQAMIGFAKKMSEASGVPLPTIMKDVAEASDDVRIYVGSSAVSMIKAATAARMMGIDLNKAASTAEKLLQFETSIGAELKASALLGQNINFNYARQLFFNKNIIDGNKEILRIAKQVRFNQLNPIQQKAFADAAGKSVGELQDLFQQEKNIALVKNSTNKEAQKAYTEYEKLMRLKDKEAETEGEIALREMVRKNNQEKLNQLQNRFNQMMSDLSMPVMELTEQLLDIAVVVLPLIINGVKLITKTFELLSGVHIAKTILSLKNLLNPFRAIKDLVVVGGGLFGKMSRYALLFTKTLGPIGKLLSPFSKLLGPVGIFISLVQAAVSIVKTLTSAFDDFKSGKILNGITKVFTAIPKAILDITLGTLYDISRLILGWFGVELPNGMWNGIKSAGDMLFESILSPFKFAWDWLSDMFMGKSPSKIGLGIVNGISSIGTMLFDVLISPFKLSYNLIIDLFKNIGEPILNGLQSIGSSVIDILTSPFKASFNWIMDNLGGKSPSKIGLGILDGITSIQSKLFENLTNPFSTAFKSITNLAPIDLGSIITFGLKDGLMSAIDPFKSSLNAVFLEFGEKLSAEIALSIAKGIKSSESVIADSIKTNISDIKLPVTEFTVDSVEKSTAVKKIETTSPLQQVIEVSNQQLIQKLDQLITLMSNGGIAVNLDGQLVSRGLASTTYKSGGFGQSTTRA